ncbi:MAG: GNAT family N-acetyltransferase [Saprospiraceae bacterium]|nr:GNAT family N-acetyltransferase [Saprospiraceae bacterium]
MKAVLSTKRLFLREANIGDAAFILELLNDEGWIKYIGDRNIRSIPQAGAYISKSLISSYKKNGFGLYVVTEKGSNNKIGLCGLLKRDILENVDVGFAFLTAFCNKGYGYESASAIIDLAFNKLNLKKVVGITLEVNHASKRLLEKIGLSFEKMITYENGEELMLYSRTKNN